MGTRAGTLSLCVALAAVAIAPACSHITKLPVAEVPIDQFQGTPVTAVPETVASVAIIQPDPPPVPAPTSTAAASASPASSKPAAPLQTLDSPEDKVQAAVQAMKTGKRADLLASRKALMADVGTPNGTPGEARMLRAVCTKLNDKACIARANLYIK
jgi:hypothetical protein